MSSGFLEKRFYPHSNFPGIVEDTKDPLQLGRVRVRVLALDGTAEEKATDKLHWCQVCENFGGNNYGSFWRPVVGDTVWVIFDTGNMNERIVIGTWYELDGTDASSRVPKGVRVVEPFKEDSTEAKDQLPAGQQTTEEKAYPDASGNPVHRMFKTPQGHIFGFNEADGKNQIYLTTKAGHHISMSDEPGNLFLLLQGSNGDYIYFDTDKGDIFMRAAHDIKISAGNELKVVVGQSESRFIGKDLLTKVAENETREIGKDWTCKVAQNWNTTVGIATNLMTTTWQLMAATGTALVGLYTWVGMKNSRVGRSSDEGGCSHS